MMKFASRILEGLVARPGLVEPRIGIGCGAAVKPHIIRCIRRWGDVYPVSW
jgi:hypothetical protein